MVLALVEIGEAGVQASSLEALTLARDVAGSLGVPVEAVVVTSDDGTDDDAGTRGDMSTVDAELRAYGVQRYHRMTHPLLVDYSPECWGEAVAQLIRQLAPPAVIAPGSDRGNEIMAQAAARADLPLAANCTTVDAGADGSGWQLTRLRSGGMLLEDAQITAPTRLVTVATGAVEPAPGPAPAAADSVTFTPDFGESFVHSRLTERAQRSAGVTLAGARVVVSGGRGVGSADGFAPLEELAKLTGGAVGCSRVATNNGWRPHTDQVGQTGTKVNPDLYIACGISGATQHWVGCMGAKAILAINTDPEAPLVTRATYAVIGDVGEVLPAVVDEIRRRAATA
ncbi:electron transfer flavoprotein subunit alpha/FixB family protein [Phytoactinopolyspora mesophila]|uniref:Electron transfer flavoprotein subunit alpha/FixB family protein n=1 Tax=Phytoactinopolyspora mesophila TaxID=2650750 RepID=A0A7K3LZ57_9ACTN|nr:electron transfer flavoprotein subunit alpha/FixB family protein [Phytoactinopolyspora mesophila]NDL56280.1 electron transfer flavoprotein subunit alpha/FixB family protein [Phytoactinopolyspora mesophila]